MSTPAILAVSLHTHPSTGYKCIRLETHADDTPRILQSWYKAREHATTLLTQGDIDRFLVDSLSTSISPERIADPGKPMDYTLASDVFDRASREGIHVCYLFTEESVWRCYKPNEKSGIWSPAPMPSSDATDTPDESSEPAASATVADAPAERTADAIRNVSEGDPTKLKEAIDFLTEHRDDLASARDTYTGRIEKLNEIIAHLEGVPLE